MNPGLDAAPGVVAVTLVTIATLVIGTWGLRFSRTTSDFFVASRTVRPRLNASAIGGEYLSGASFLGVAGLVLAFGTDMLWYPVGWTAGYLVLLAFAVYPFLLTVGWVYVRAAERNEQHFTDVVERP